MRTGRHKGVLSIILVPPGGGKPRSFNVGKRGMIVATVLASLLVALVVFSFSTLGRMGRLSVTVSGLRRENTTLKEDQAKFGRLEDELAQLRALERRVARLIGVEQEATDREEPVSPAGLLTLPSSQTTGYSGRVPTLWPVQGEISRRFSEKRGGHKGIDIAVARETPVRAAGDGTVEFAGEDNIFGNMIIINHGSGISSLYGHSSRLTVARGESVRKGQIIAYSGSSGRSSAPHLHFEISRYGKQMDPLTFLSEQ